MLERTGDVTRAEELRTGLGDVRVFGAPIALAVSHLISGDVNRAADWMELAITQRYPGILCFLNLPLGARRTT